MVIAAGTRGETERKRKKERDGWEEDRKTQREGRRGGGGKGEVVWSRVRQVHAERVSCECTYASEFPFRECDDGAGNRGFAASILDEATIPLCRKGGRKRQRDKRETETEKWKHKRTHGDERARTHALVGSNGKGSDSFGPTAANRDI